MSFVDNAKNIKRLVSAINNKDCEVLAILRAGPGVNDSWKVICDSREAIGTSPEDASKILLEALKNDLNNKITFNEAQSNGFKKILESVMDN